MASRICTLLLAASLTAAKILPEAFTDQETGEKFHLVTRDDAILPRDDVLQATRTTLGPGHGDVHHLVARHKDGQAIDPLADGMKTWYNCTRDGPVQSTVIPMYGCSRDHGWNDLVDSLPLKDTNFRQVLHDLLFATMGPWKFDTEAMGRDSLCSLIGSPKDLTGLVRNGIVVGHKLCISFGPVWYSPVHLIGSNITADHLLDIEKFAMFCANTGGSSGFHVEDTSFHRIIICISNRPNGCGERTCGRRRMQFEYPHEAEHKLDVYDPDGWVDFMAPEGRVKHLHRPGEAATNIEEDLKISLQ